MPWCGRTEEINHVSIASSPDAPMGSRRSSGLVCHGAVVMAWFTLWFALNMFAALALVVRAHKKEYPNGSTPTHKPSDGRRYGER